MYQYESAGARHKWPGLSTIQPAVEEDSYTFQNEFPPKPDPLAMQTEQAQKALSSLFDCITSLFVILSTQDDEIKELREELAKHKQTDLERHGWAGGSVSELKDRIDQLSYGLGIVEKRLEAHTRAHVKRIGDRMA